MNQNTSKNILELLNNFLKEEFTGKNVQDAIKTGLRKISMSQNEIVFKVLSEGSPGLFDLAGNKLSKVVISPKPDKIENFLKYIISLILRIMFLEHFSSEIKKDKNMFYINLMIKDKNIDIEIKKNNCELYNAILTILREFLKKMNQKLEIFITINNFKPKNIRI